jgi:UDP-N-acetylmuramoyl-L-alanyl-D-glutamate--2,6-diaminopimelate ligase
VEQEVSVSALLDAVGEHRVVGTPRASVRRVVADSRQVEAGDCFVAVPGFKQDARRFVPEAAARGAAIVVTEGEALPVDVCQVLVPSARAALGRLAAAWHRHPSRDLVVVGITGTNGKTTTSYLIDALLRALGFATGVIGTVQYVIRGEALPASQTTPEALELQGLLARMRDEGVRGVAMEVSSHALALARVEDVDFDVAVFTNLTQDHLDFHGTLDEYRRAKRHLFELLARSSKPGRIAVVNGDDPSGAEMVRGLDLAVSSFGLGPATVRATTYDSSLDGIRMAVETPAGRLTLASPLIGEHNVMNLLAAVATGLGLGLDGPTIADALGAVGAVPGRFERVDAGQPFLVIVDYAHTPDALERVLATARKITPGRLAVVFGCGGDRDRGKRPIMGEIAARLADQVWVTSDNPRSERPEAIIADVMAGVRRATARAKACVTLPGRHDAIREALTSARPGDTVVIAGKGHESYQIIGSDVLPFDDREIARQILLARSADERPG